MAQSIVIAEPSYLLKRGLSTIISDIVQTEIIFVNGLDELNHYLESNLVDFVIINEGLLKDKAGRDLLFQLQSEAKYLVLTESGHDLPGRDKYAALIDIRAPKESIVPILEEVLTDESVQENNRSSILSDREKEVLKQVAMGYTNQEIADRLFISKHTVISHRKNITSKLGIKTVSGLTVYAVLNNLIPKDQIQ